MSLTIPTSHDELNQNLQKGLLAFRQAPATEDGVRGCQTAMEAVPELVRAGQLGVNPLPPLRAHISNLQPVLLGIPIAQVKEKLNREVSTLRSDISSRRSDDDIPEEALARILAGYQAVLAHEWRRIYFETYEPGLAWRMPEFFEGLKQRSVILQAFAKALPTPLPASKRLEEISRQLGLQGNPLFPWWDHRPDFEKAADLLLDSTGGEVAQKEEESDWDAMPEELKKWDWQAWQWRTAIPAQRDTIVRFPTLKKSLVYFDHNQMAAAGDTPVSASVGSPMKDRDPERTIDMIMAFPEPSKRLVQKCDETLLRLEITLKTPLHILEDRLGDGAEQYRVLGVYHKRSRGLLARASAEGMAGTRWTLEIPIFDCFPDLVTKILTLEDGSEEGCMELVSDQLLFSLDKAVSPDVKP
jgi:hypothetical protein